MVSRSGSSSHIYIVHPEAGLQLGKLTASTHCAVAAIPWASFFYNGGVWAIISLRKKVMIIQSCSLSIWGLVKDRWSIMLCMPDIGLRIGQRRMQCIVKLGFMVFLVLKLCCIWLRCRSNRLCICMLMKSALTTGIDLHTVRVDLSCNYEPIGRWPW